MPHDLVQRRGVPQAQALAERFGQESLGASVDLPPSIFPAAKVTRVDYPAMAGVDVAGLAANRSNIQLLNPVGSGTDLIIKRVWASVNPTESITFRTHDTPLTTLISTVTSMVRQEGTSQVFPVGQLRTAQSAAVGSTVSFVQGLANDTLFFNFEFDDGEEFNGFVLQPGRGLLIAPNADNIRMRATWMWLERTHG